MIRSLFAFVSLGVALAGNACAGDKDTPERKLTIVHTNDLHARLLSDAKSRGGFAEIATAIRNACAGTEGCLVMDGGDLVQGSPVSSLFQGVPVYEIANRLGLDVSTLGNHEFDYGWKKIPKFLEIADFPVLNSNLRHPSEERLGDASSIVLTTTNGVRVGVVGAITETLPYLVAPDQLGEWEARPVVDTVAPIVAKLRKKVDLLVVLGHVTDDEEHALLDIPGVDFVIAGHGHAGLTEPVTDDDTAILRVRAFGHQIGKLDVRVDIRNDRVTDWSWKAIPVQGSDLEPDAATLEIVNAWEAKVSALVDIDLAEIGHDHDRVEMKDLFERALAEETGADLAYVNPGAIRGKFFKGMLRVRDVWTAMPFEDAVVTGTFKGSEFPRSVRAERGLEADRSYRFASIDFVVAQWRLQGIVDLDVEHGELYRDLLIRWIGKQERLD